MKNKKMKIKFWNLAALSTLITSAIIVTSCGDNEQVNNVESKPEEKIDNNKETKKEIINKEPKNPKEEINKKDSEPKNPKEEINKKDPEPKPKKQTNKKDSDPKKEKIQKPENLVEQITINHSIYNQQKYLLDQNNFLVNFSEKPTNNLVFQLVFEKLDKTKENFTKKVVLNNSTNVKQASFELGSLPKSGKWKIKSIKNLLNNQEWISKITEEKRIFDYLKIEPVFLTRFNFSNSVNFDNKTYLTDESKISLFFDKNLTFVKKGILKLKNLANSELETKELIIPLNGKLTNSISLSLKDFVKPGTWLIESIKDENQIFEFKHIAEKSNLTFNFINKIPNMLNKLEFLNLTTIQDQEFLTPNSQIKLFFNQEIDNNYHLIFNFQNTKTNERISSKFLVSKDENDSKIGFINFNSQLKEGNWKIISINNEELISSKINQTSILTTEQNQFKFLTTTPNLIESISIKNDYSKNDKKYLIENSKLALNFTNPLTKAIKLLIKFKNLINSNNVISQEFVLSPNSDNSKSVDIDNLKTILNSGKWEIISIRDLINPEIEIDQINNLNQEARILEFWNSQQNNITNFEYDSEITIDNKKYLVTNSKINLTFEREVEPNAKIKIQLQKLEANETIIEEYTLNLIHLNEKQGYIQIPKLSSEGRWKIISLQDINHNETIQEQVDSENLKEFDYLYQEQNFIKRISIDDDTKNVFYYKDKVFYHPKTKVYIEFKDKVCKPLKLRFVLQNIETQEEMIINKTVEGIYGSWEYVSFYLGELDQEGEFRIISIKDITNGEDAKEQVDLILEKSKEFNYLKQKQNFIEKFEIVDAQKNGNKTYLSSDSTLKLTFKNLVTTKEPVKLAIQFRKEDNSEETQEISFEADYNATDKVSHNLKKIKNYNGMVEIISIKDITNGENGIEQISLIQDLPNQLYYLKNKQNFATNLQVIKILNSLPTEDNKVLIGVNNETTFKFKFQKKMIYKDKFKMKLGFKTENDEIFYKEFIVSQIENSQNDSQFAQGQIKDWPADKMAKIFSIKDITHGEENAIEQINFINLKYS